MRYALKNITRRVLNNKLLYLLISLLIFSTSIFASPINTTENVSINGIKQYIAIKGNDVNNPIILFMHGGPGRSIIPFADAFTKQLPDKFIVEQWDQRETGESLKLNSSNEKITVALLQSDALEMVRALLKKYNRKKLYLVSHSWGSVMGFEIAKKHPELFYAYISISPVVDANKGSQLTVNCLKDCAGKTKNDTVLQELSKIKIPYQDTTDIYFAQKWLFAHNEVDGALSEKFKANFYKWLQVWFPVWLENAKSNLFVTAPKIKCPIYFFIGSGDNQTFYTIAEEYYKVLKAKNKKLIWFTKSGHTIFNSEPEKLEQELIDTVLKETYK